ncbi:MAG: hypothetical protein Q9222_001240 [Ikaeria aurantiellina]
MTVSRKSRTSQYLPSPDSDIAHIILAFHRDDQMTPGQYASEPPGDVHPYRSHLSTPDGSDRPRRRSVAIRDLLNPVAGDQNSSPPRHHDINSNQRRTWSPYSSSEPDPRLEVKDGASSARRTTRKKSTSSGTIEWILDGTGVESERPSASNSPAETLVVFSASITVTSNIMASPKYDGEIGPQLPTRNMDYVPGLVFGIHG